MERRRLSFSAFKEEKVLSGLSPALNVLITAARRAGHSILRDYGELEALLPVGGASFDFIDKAFQKAERNLVGYLKMARPRYSFLLPENQRIEGEDTSNCFIVNPLDGKGNFIRTIPFFAISAALQRDNDILAGVIYNPVMDELFYAEKGSGTFIMSGNGDRRLRVSDCKNISSSTIAIDFSRQTGQEVRDYQNRMFSIAAEADSVRRMGCVSLSMAYTAFGKFDGHWCRYADATQVAAGYVMVREAGGYVKSVEGEMKMPDILYAKSIISTNSNLEPFLSNAIMRGK